MHYSSKYENAPMPYSVFFNDGIAVHATSETKHLGRPASHGCVRLSKADAEVFFRAVADIGMMRVPQRAPRRVMGLAKWLSP